MKTKLHLNNKLNYIKLSFIMLFLCSSLITFSQADDYAKEKAKTAETKTKRKADREVDNEIDRQIDKAFNGVKGLFKKKNKKKNSSEEAEPEYRNRSEVNNQDREQEEESGSFGGFGAIDYDKIYTLKNVYSYKATFTKGKNGKESISDFDFLTPDDSQDYMGILTVIEEGNSAITITDKTENAMIILVDNKDTKTGMYSAFDDLETALIDVDESDFEADDIKFSATGNTKKVYDLYCIEYAYETDTDIGTAWFTNDLTFNFYRMFGEAFKKYKNKKSQNIPLDIVNGMMVEMHTENKSNKDKSTMILTGISKRNMQIRTKEYQIMNLGGFMNR